MPKNKTLADNKPASWTDDGILHRVTYQGQLLIWKCRPRCIKQPPRGAKRPMYNFSPASRFRMLKEIATIQWENALPAQFVTLTYPDPCRPTSNAKISQARWTFWRYLEGDRSRKMCGLWRTEWKNRLTGMLKGSPMPHIHLMIYRQGFLCKEKIRDWWARSLQWDGYVDVDQELCEDGTKVGQYVSKYQAKVDPSILGNCIYLSKMHGRLWGLFRKNLIPREEKMEMLLPAGEMADVARELAGWQEGEVNEFGSESFTSFGPLAERIGKYLFKGGLDPRLEMP